jgi:hypothetical protein
MSSKVDPEASPERKLVDERSFVRETADLRPSRNAWQETKKMRVETWISEHPDWASLVTSEDVRAAKALKPGDNNDEDRDNETSPTSDLLRPYVDLQDGGALNPGDESLFIAEGADHSTPDSAIGPSEDLSSRMNAPSQIDLCEAQCFCAPPSSSLPTSLRRRPLSLETMKQDRRGSPFHVFVMIEDTSRSVAGFQISIEPHGKGPDRRNEAWLMDHLEQQNKNSGGLRLLALDGISTPLI